jgi:hypothetical protein
MDPELEARLGSYGDWLHSVAIQELRDAEARGEPRRDMGCPPGTLGAALRVRQYFKCHFMAVGPGSARWGEHFSDTIRQVTYDDLVGFGRLVQYVRTSYEQVGSKVPGYDADYVGGLGILLDDFLERFPEVREEMHVEKN